MLFATGNSSLEIIRTVNLIFRMISVIMSIVVLLTVVHMKDRNKRMGWFLAALGMLMGGLAAEFMAENFQASNLLRGGISMIRANIFFSFVAPFFTLYFIETEREEGQEWDGTFWAVLHGMIVVLIIILSIYDKNSFFVWGTFVAQYVLVAAMLLVSPKDIGASMWFVSGSLFPVLTSFAGISLQGIRLTGFGLVMMLLMVLFGYQAEVERELLEKRTELSESRVSLLMEQIHPHFIYNSLQQIALLCDRDTEVAKEAIYSFSRYLRSNFESLTDEGMIPFEKEMEHVDMFLQAAGISISRGFEVQKEFEVTDFMLPALSLQPLVENAVQYGIGMSTEGDRILIRTEEKDGYIVIRVIDDGHGKQTKIGTQEKHKSIGRKNVAMRLKLLCEGSLELVPSEQGTEAVIRIPVKYGKKRGE